MKVLLQASRSQQGTAPTTLMAFKPLAPPLSPSAPAASPVIANTSAPETRQGPLPSIEAKLQEAELPSQGPGRARSSTEAARAAVQAVTPGRAS